MSDTDTFVAALQSFAAAVSAACNDPADAVRILSTMAALDTSAILGTTAIPAAMETTRAATTAAGRRAALTALARACAAYQPTSYNDALTLRAAVSALFDTEVLAAADTGDRRCYLAFKQLRTAVVTDLTSRGAALPPLTTVMRRRSLPALALAQQLYQDATRTAQLVAGASGVPASAFMPVSFVALAE